MAKMLNVSCPSCQTINTMEKAFIGWRNNTCLNCGAKLRASDAADEKQVVVCASCHRNVAWDPSKGDNCPICGNSLARQQSERAIACPVCGVAVRYQDGASQVACPACSTSFDPVSQRTKIQTIMESTATDIQMPEGALKPGEIIWHHPTSQFSINARVIAAPGMQAVVLQGGTVAAVVDGESVRLSETRLKNDSWNYDGAADKKVNVDVYYVSTRFNGIFTFGGGVDLQMPYNRVANVPVFASCSIAEVTNAAAFLAWASYNRNGDVVEDEFSVKVNANGGKTPGKYAKLLREEVLTKVLGRAMLAVCAGYNIHADQLNDYTPQVMEQIELLANERLAEIGLRVTVGSGTVSAPEVKERVVDQIVPGLAGTINWETKPIVVHIAGKVMATATLKADGGLYATVNDADALNRSPEGSKWRADPRSAREDVRTHICNALTARFTAIIQQIIDEYQPALHMLPMFNGLIMSQAALLLNQQGEFFQRHGLFASDLTVNLRIVEKSTLFELEEKNAVLPDELALKERIRDLEREFATRDFIKDRQDELVRKQAVDQIEGQKLISEANLDDVRTDVDIRAIQNQVRREQAHKQAQQTLTMQELENKHQIDETIRRYSYEAWRDQQALADQQMAAEMNRERMQQQHMHAKQKANAVQEADLERLAQEVGLSKLSFREKMDAYARIQRNLAFQDQMDQKTATSRSQADNEAYAAGLALQLSENSRKVMQNLDYEQKLHEEDLQKARFAREMETRRQELAAEMSRLNAQFERERALAAEAEQCRRSENEVETLKLMLEFLAKDSENQVTAQRMQAAREHAERSWQMQHADLERQQSAARRQEQQAAEQQMADRAYELVQQMNAMQHELDKMKLENERAYNQGRAMVDARGPMYQQSQMDALKAQMVGLQNAVKTLGAQVAQTAPVADMGKTFAGMADQMRSTFTGSPAPQPQMGYGSMPQSGYNFGAAPVSASPAYGQGAPAYGQGAPTYGQGYGMQPGMQGMNTCKACGMKYSVGLGCCPHCGAR